MAVNGRRKGSTYERKIADVFGKAFKLQLKRTPMSGGWSKETVQGDIVPVGEDSYLALSIECKNYKTFPKQPYLWLLQAINDAKGTEKIPTVVFHIPKTTNSNKFKLNQTTEIVNPFPRGEDFVITKLSDFVKIVNKKKLKDKSKWKRK